MDCSRVLYTWFLSEQLEWLLCIMLTKDKTENTEQVSSDFPRIKQSFWHARNSQKSIYTLSRIAQYFKLALFFF